MFALLNDVHIGARNNNEYVRKAQERFFFRFFQYLKKNNIKTVAILGDFFDKRKIIDFKSLEFAHESFFSVAKEKGINIILLLGNHDVYFKSTNRLNSPSMLLGQYSNVKIIDVPMDLKIEGVSCAMIPWITEDNHEACVNHLKSTMSPVVLGHFELVGFEMIPGVESKIGFEVSDFDRFDIVLSGHYHLKSSRKNVHQLGCQYEMDWGDFGMDKGFHVYSKEDGLQFIRNDDPLHVRLVYEGKKLKEVPDVRDKFVKVVVESYEKKSVLEELIENIRNARPADLRIIDNTSADEAVEEFKSIEGMSITDIFKTAVGALEGVSEESKTFIEDEINSIYMEAVKESKED